jgi:hypothetical protein
MDTISYGSAAPALPSLGRLLVFAVLIPAAVAVSNQALLKNVSTYHELRALVYPWMAASTAVLSWSVGRYLSPAWLRWLVFGWCLALLDLLTIAACLGSGVPRHLGYVLVSAQISLVVLWAILANVSWQWRLPAVLATATAVLVFSGSFDDAWNARDWNLLMIVTAAVGALLCTALRSRGFTLRDTNRATLGASDGESFGIHQFGLKHLLFWATALAPILLIARGLDFLLFKRLGGPDLFPFVLVALSIACVNLIAIWAVLGHGRISARLVALLVIPYLLAIGLSQYLQYVESTYRIRRTGSRGQTYQTWSNAWYDSLVNGIFDANEAWSNWLWLDAALLAALLLFLRAGGYRLMRNSRSPRSRRNSACVFASSQVRSKKIFAAGRKCTGQRYTICAIIRGIEMTVRAWLERRLAGWRAESNSPRAQP